MLVAAPVVAQDLADAQLFAPADISEYGSGQMPAEGYFFSFDGIWWSISSPDIVPVGFPGLTRTVFHTPTTQEVQANTHDTGELQSEFTNGNRFEFGRVHDRNGWICSIYNMKTQEQWFAGSDIDIVFQDIAFGAVGQRHLQGWVGEPQADGSILLPFLLADLPVSFDELIVRNKVDTWNVELMFLHRTRPTHHNVWFDLFAGVRYLEFDDAFSVDALGSERDDLSPGNSRFVYDADDVVIGPGAVLADSNWATEAENHVVGPQLGIRMFKTRGRWTFSTEGRFLAGFNSQNIRTKGTLGTKLDLPMVVAEVPDPNPQIGYPFVPLIRDPYNFGHTRHFTEWSPVIELRAELTYQLTRAVSVKAGWTGIWMDGIARANGMNDYTISSQSVMGINPANNTQDMFMHGLNIGVTVNR